MFDCGDSEFESTVLDARATTVEVRLRSGRRLLISQQLEPRDLAPLFEDEWTGSQASTPLSQPDLGGGTPIARGLLRRHAAMDHG